jgi:hypothetical protein
MLQDGPLGRYTIVKNRDGTHRVSHEEMEIEIFALSSTYVVVDARRQYWLKAISQLIMVSKILDLEPVLLAGSFTFAEEKKCLTIRDMCEEYDIILESGYHGERDDRIRGYIHDKLGYKEQTEAQEAAEFSSDSDSDDSDDESNEPDSTSLPVIPLLPVEAQPGHDDSDLEIDLTEMVGRVGFYRETKHGFAIEIVIDEEGMILHGVDPLNNGNIVPMNAEQRAYAVKIGLTLQ